LRQSFDKTFNTCHLATLAYLSLPIWSPCIQLHSATMKELIGKN
jgi:hypothetical protein